jgi:hypoxanthine phosphoribosyltransferase
MNDNYALIASSKEVDAHVDAIATKLLARYPETPLFVALLRGAAPFASKLMFTIATKAPDYHPDLDYMMISTYGEAHTAKQPVIVTDLAPTTDVKGRAVVILDDVIDQGVTSDFVRDLLLGRGAKSVELATLATKNVPGRTSQADYTGFDAGDRWLVGMGLDDAKHGHEHYRWMDSIWEIKH